MNMQWSALMFNSANKIVSSLLLHDNIIVMLYNVNWYNDVI